MTALLSTTYFGPIQWYQKLYRYDKILIERHESFTKQTYRNRCVIATPNGQLSLSVPTKPINLNSQISNTNQAHRHLSPQISDHGNWRHVHWNALKSAYGESPFFEYYADDIVPFFEEKEWDNLFEYNLAICHTVCNLLDISPNITLTDHYITSEEACECGISDFRDIIRPKNPKNDEEFVPRRYYQVYEQRHGFLPNMSILDLLFNMGNESILWL